MSVAFVFPGQGSQSVGMGKALADAFPEARAVFEEADRSPGLLRSPRLCFEGPEADLQLTANTQPAILATSIAALRALEARGRRAAGLRGRAQPGRVLGPGGGGDADACATRCGTVRRRGQYMQEAVPVGQGAMAAILGLDLPAIEAACAEAAAGRGGRPRPTSTPRARW